MDIDRFVMLVLAYIGSRFVLGCWGGVMGRITHSVAGGPICLEVAAACRPKNGSEATSGGDPGDELRALRAALPQTDALVEGNRYFAVMSTVAPAPQPDPDRCPWSNRRRGDRCRHDRRAPWHARILRHDTCHRCQRARPRRGCFGFRSPRVRGAAVRLLLTLGYFVARRFVAVVTFIAAFCCRRSLSLRSTSARHGARNCRRGVRLAGLFCTCSRSWAHRCCSHRSRSFSSAHCRLAILVDAGCARWARSQGIAPVPDRTFGAALFALSALLRALSARLASQERLARTRGRDLKTSWQSIASSSQMDQGDRRRSRRVGRANNRAARMLGMDSTAQLTGERPPIFRPRANWRSRFRFGAKAVAVRSVVQHDRSAPGARHRRPRVAATRTLRSSVGADFRGIRDLHRRRARCRRPRAAAAAAMGRLTASIAHEPQSAGRNQ